MSVYSAIRLASLFYSVVVLVLSPTASFAQEQASLPLSYVAIYNLKANNPDTDVNGYPRVEGQYIITQQVICDDLSTETQMILSSTSETGEISITQNDQAMHESLSGLTYATKNVSAFGTIRAETSGNATLQRVGGEGKGAFKGSPRYPERLTTLPEGTLFPYAYLNALINAAKAGKSQFDATVFDGQTQAFGVALIESRFDSPQPVTSAPLLGIGFVGRKVLPVTFVRKNWGDEDIMITGSLNLLDNGVAESMSYAVGSNRMTATLANISLREAKPCTPKTP